VSVRVGMSFLVSVRVGMSFLVSVRVGMSFRFRIFRFFFIVR